MLESEVFAGKLKFKFFSLKAFKKTSLVSFLKCDFILQCFFFKLYDQFFVLCDLDLFCSTIASEFFNFELLTKTCIFLQFSFADFPG